MSKSLISQERDIREGARQHHICHPPEGVEIEHGFCTVFALSSAASYVTDLTPDEAFVALFSLTQETPIEDTPLADVYRLGILPPIISSDGTVYLNVWLRKYGGRYAGMAMGYLNAFLGERLGIELVPLIPNASFDLTWLNLRDAVQAGNPVEMSVIYYPGSGRYINHSVLLSPFSDDQIALIHDSMCEDVISLRWDTVRRMASGNPIELYKGIDYEVDLWKHQFVVRSFQEID